MGVNASRYLILLLEINPPPPASAMNTAEEANSDRTHVVQLYLTIFAGALAAYQYLCPMGEAHLHSQPLLQLVFFGVWAIGFSCLFKLIRLRQALWGSIKTMNRIKAFYQSKFPELANALEWSSTSLPAAGKPWSISYNLAILVVSLDSVALATAVALRLQSDFPALGHFVFLAAILDILTSCFVQERFYHYHMYDGVDEKAGHPPLNITVKSLETIDGFWQFCNRTVWGSAVINSTPRSSVSITSNEKSVEIDDTSAPVSPLAVATARAAATTATKPARSASAKKRSAQRR